MDKNLACHAIALETAKIYVNSNLPEYTNISGTAGVAKDMVTKYIEAYKIASKAFDDNKEQSPDK